MDSKNLNILGIIAIIGSVLLIVGVFVTWMSDSFSTYSGWDLVSDKDNIKNIIKYGYCPLIALICGILSLVLMVIPTVMNIDKYRKINNILGIVALLLAIVVIVVEILWYTQTVDISIWHGIVHVTKKLTEVFSIGAGFWITLIGAIFTALGGLMPIVKNKLL